MKKRSGKKSSFVRQGDQPDITGMILQIQQQLTFLDKKIDGLISRPPERPFEREDRPRPFQRFDQSHRQGERRPDANFRERVLHKAICAECNKECQVPFRPTQDRPVYCKDCFSKRKGADQFRGTDDNRPRGSRPDQASHFDKPRYGEKKKFFPKSKSAGKRRKTHD